MKYPLLMVAVMLIMLSSCSISAQIGPENFSFDKYNEKRSEYFKNRSLDSLYHETLEILEFYPNLPEKKVLEHAYFYRTIGIIFHLKGNLVAADSNYNIAITIIEHGLSTQKEQQGKEGKELAAIYLNRGGLANDQGKFQEAIKLLNKGLVYIKDRSDTDRLLGKFLTNLGNTYSSIGYFDLAEKHYREAQKVKKRVPNLPAQTIASTYTNLGALYLDVGDFQLAQENFIVAEKILIENYDSVYVDLGLIYNNFGLINHEKKDYVKAIYFFRKAEEIYIKNGLKGSYETGRIYANLANTFNEKMSYDSASIYADYSLKIMEEVFGNQANPYSPSGYLLKFIASTKKSDWENADIFFETGIKMVNEVYGSKSKSAGVFYNQMGRLKVDNEEYQAAKRYYTLALKALNYEDIKINIDHAEQISIELFHTLFNLGLLHNSIYDQERTIKNLNLAERYFDEALEVKHILYNKLTSQSSKYLLSDQSKVLIEHSINTQYKLYEAEDNLSCLEKIYELAEQGKTRVLVDEMSNLDHYFSAELPDSIVKRLHRLKIEISLLELRQQENEFINDQENKIAQTQTLIELKKDYKDFLKEIKDIYPNYYYAFIESKNVSLNRVQKDLLLPNQKMIQYVVGDSNLYILLIDQNQLEVKKVKIDSYFNKQVEDLRYSLIAPFVNRNLSYQEKEDHLKRYTELAYQLFQSLIQPIESDIKGHDLVIIPDGSLSRIPFEALLTEKPDKYFEYGSHKYLIRKHAISYGYSATVLTNSSLNKAIKSTEVNLVIAPFIDGAVLKEDYKDIAYFRDSQGELPVNGLDLPAIFNPSNSIFLRGKAATEHTVLQELKNANIIHFTTHGFLAENIPFLMFYHKKDGKENEVLYLSELYDLNLNLELAFLDACSSGEGDLISGEGLISLARAFTYSGTKSIVSTLWPVRAKKDPIFLETFYAEIFNNERKDKALKAAKEVLMNLEGLKAHPYFWAGYTLSGKVQSDFNYTSLQHSESKD